MKKRVLLVDDSASALLGLTRLLEASESFEVVGQARTASAALHLAESTLPDLVTMDVYLDGQDGVEVAKAILARVMTRLVLVTGLDPARADLAFRGLAAGALDVLGKPSLAEGEVPVHERRRFLAALRALSEVGLVGRHRPAAALPAAPIGGASECPVALVALGASTGGPATLFKLLAALPRPFPAPVVIVQHIEPAHGHAFVEWLASTGHEVVLVEEQLPARAGVVCVASGQAHLTFSEGKLGPSPGAPRNFQLPSVDVLFESLAASVAPRTFAALLSGMGEDGAVGLAALASRGATTVVQSLESCVVPGMPSAGLRLQGARLELAPEEIAAAAERFVTTCQREIGRGERCNP